MHPAHPQSADLREAAVLRCLLLALSVLASNASSSDLSARRIESELVRNAQDQRFVDQQMRIGQALLHSEESTRPPAGELPFASRPRFELRLPPATQAPSALARHADDEVNRLRLHYRDLESERRALLRALSIRMRQQTQDDY